MKLLMLLIFVFRVGEANAMVVAGNGLCPEAFEGRVKEVIDEIGPETPFSKQTILLLNLQTIRGEIKEQVSVDILKNGPIEIEVGKEYRVQLRKGKLCWIEQI